MHQKDQKDTVCVAHINIFVTFFPILCCPISVVCCLCCLWLYKYPQSPIIPHLPGSISLCSPPLSPFFNLILSFNKCPFCPQWKHSMCLKLLCTPQSWPLCFHTANFISLELCLACRKPCSFRLHRWRNKLWWSTKFSRWAVWVLLQTGCPSQSPQELCQVCVFLKKNTLSVIEAPFLFPETTWIEICPLQSSKSQMCAHRYTPVQLLVWGHKSGILI